MKNAKFRTKSGRRETDGFLPSGFRLWPEPPSAKGNGSSRAAGFFDAGKALIFFTGTALGAALAMTFAGIGFGPFAALMSESNQTESAAPMTMSNKEAGEKDVSDSLSVFDTKTNATRRIESLPAKSETAACDGVSATSPLAGNPKKSSGDYKSLYGPVPLPDELAAVHAANASAHVYPSEITGEDTDLLVWSCAQGLSPDLTKVLVQAFSMGEPWAIGIVGDIVRAGVTKEKAVALIRDARTNRLNFNVGLMQLNASTLAPFGASPEEALDPCTNLSIAAAQIRSAYEKHMSKHPLPFGAPQEALSLASGNAAAAAVADYMKANHIRRKFGPSATSVSVEHAVPSTDLTVRDEHNGDAAPGDILPDKDAAPTASPLSNVTDSTVSSGLIF